MSSKTSNKPERARSISSKRAVALFLAAAAAFVITSAGLAEQDPDQVNVQGGWAYTAKDKGGAVEHVAATRAAEDAVWLTLGCKADGRLAVSFPLQPVSMVKLQSNNVPTALVEAKNVENNQIFVAPLLMRHIMPLVMQDDQLVASIPDRDGAMHSYTFSMQPNDLALKPIRARCFDF